MLSIHHLLIMNVCSCVTRTPGPTDWSSFGKSIYPSQERFTTLANRHISALVAPSVKRHSPHWHQRWRNKSSNLHQFIPHSVHGPKQPALSCEKLTMRLDELSDFTACGTVWQKPPSSTPTCPKRTTLPFNFFRLTSPANPIVKPHARFPKNQHPSRPHQQHE